ncbi:MAG: oligosaccharide flippase family protein [bacterium]|nr:oligosaccharide flippase family protein [bacterium]
MGYTGHTLRGFSWQTFLKFGTAGIALVKISLLSHLLSPADFGVFAIVLVTLGISEATTQTGVNITLLQTTRSIRYYLSTAWVIAITRGLFIAILMSCLGLVLAQYFDNPLLAPLTAVAALVPLIKGFINPSLITYQKELRFSREAAFRLSLSLIETTATIFFAVFIRSPLAMLLGLVFIAFVEVIASFLLFSERPTLQFHKNRAKDILQNSLGLSPAALLSYVGDNIDDFLIGKLLGTYKLGLYHNAYALSHKPNYDISKALNHSTLPIFAKMLSDKQRLKNAFLKSSISLISLIVVISLPLFIFPTQLVSLLFGEAWAPIAPVLPLLALAGILQSCNNLGYNLWLASKKYFLLNTHLTLSVGTLIVSIFYFVSTNDFYGTGQAILLSRIIPLPLLIIGVYKTLKHAT